MLQIRRLKFRSTFAKIANIRHFFNKYALLLLGTPFSRKKNPGGHAGGLAKGGGITKIGFGMPKIPKCRLETYWANKEVFTCPKSQNVIWKPTGLTKGTFLFYGPMAPGPHRAHTFLINIFIYLF